MSGLDILNPIASGNWNYDAAAHLAMRGGFGELPAELQKWASQGLDSTLEHLLHTSPPAAAPLDWAYPTRDEDLLQRIRNPQTTPEEKAQLGRQSNERKAELASEEFHSDRARGSTVKSPVQYIIQARRTLGLTAPSGPPLTFIYRQLGQLPFYPPNVKGWDGGKSWINTGTLAYRYELARELVNGILPEQVGLPRAPAKPTPRPHQ